MTLTRGLLKPLFRSEVAADAALAQECSRDRSLPGLARSRARRASFMLANCFTESATVAMPLGLLSTVQRRCALGKP